MDISSIRMWISGGVALPMAVAEGFRKMYGKYPLQGYGLTEASPVTCCNRRYGIKKPVENEGGC